MHVRDRRLGQIDPATLSASLPEIDPPTGFTAVQFFLLAVASGVTVWFITRALDRRRR